MATSAIVCMFTILFYYFKNMIIILMLPVSTMTLACDLNFIVSWKMNVVCKISVFIIYWCFLEHFLTLKKNRHWSLLLFDRLRSAEPLSLEPKLTSAWRHCSGSQLRQLCPQGTLGNDGDISCITGRCCWSQWVEARGTPTHPSRAGRTRPPQPCHWVCNQEGSAPRPQCP